MEFRKSDVLGEALNAVIANDSEARRSLMDKFAQTYLMFPVPLRKAIWEGFIQDIQKLDDGKKKSKRKAEKDFKAEVKKKMKGGTSRAVQSPDYQVKPNITETIKKDIRLFTFRPSIVRLLTRTRAT